jgi:hypothetical protein
MRQLALLRFGALALVSLLFPICLAAESLKFPSSSSTFDMQTAEEALELCSKHFADKTSAVFRQYGLSVVAQRNYGKTSSDVDHTSAYTLGRGNVRVAGREREAFILAVRGTDAAEWYSNFDFAPSRSDSSFFAESFLFSAQDIFLNAYPIIQGAGSSRNPVILVCGHSRGAACANLLGLLFNAMFQPSDVYVYTFATPATVRMNDYDAPNIFNVINPCDCVPRLPLAAWGYSRAGKDIILPADPSSVRKLDDALTSLSALAGDVNSYYFARHSLLRKGLSDDGMTVFQAFILLSECLSNLKPYSMESPVSLQFGALPESASDFSPLLGVLQNLAADGGSGAKALLNEHMPDTYLKLMKGYK